MTLRQKTIRYGIPTVKENCAFESIQRALGGGVFFDDVTNINSTNIAIGPTANDAIYCGVPSPNKFSGIWTSCATASSVAHAIEYWTGTTWQGATITAIRGTPSLSATSMSTWRYTNQFPIDWQSTTINGVTGYYVRYRKTSTGAAGGHAQFYPMKNIYVLGGATGISGNLYNTIQIDETPRVYKSVFARIHCLSNLDYQSDFQKFDFAINDNSTKQPFVQNLISNQQFLNSSGICAFEWIIDLSDKFTSYGATNSTSEQTLLSCSLEQLIGGAYSDLVRYWGGELFLTYEYNDATQIRETNTVILPFDTRKGTLTTYPTYTVVGSTGQLPALTGTTGILKESGITIQDLYFVFDHASNNTGATGATYSTKILPIGRIDTGTTFTIPRGLTDFMFPVYSYSTQSLGVYNNGCVINLKDLVDTTQQHTLSVAGGSTAQRLMHGFDNLGGYLVATYSFDADSSKRTQTLTFPCQIDSGYLVSGVTGRQIFNIDFNIQDQNPVLLQSAFNFQLCRANVIISQLACGSRNPSGYTGAGSFVKSKDSYYERIDSGGTGMTLPVLGLGGLTFSRGFNQFIGSYYTTSTVTNGGQIDGMLYITYYYDVSENKKPSCCWYLGSNYGMTTTYGYGNPYGGTSTTFSIKIPESLYYLNSIDIMEFDTWFNVNYGNSYKIEKDLTENSNLYQIDGYYNPTTVFRVTDNNSQTYNMKTNLSLNSFFKKYKTDPNFEKSEITTDRKMWISGMVSNFGRPNNIYISNWHDYGYSISGQIFNSDGGYIEIKAYTTYDNTLISTTGITGNGYYNLDWYDNTYPVYVVAEETNQKYGISKKLTAGGPTAFNISLINYENSIGYSL